MAEPVTYADLRFTDIQLREMKPSVDLEDNNAEDGDVTYENVTTPNLPRVRAEPPVPPTAAMDLLRTDFRHRVPVLSLILLLLSLLLMASTIGLTVKYIDLSHKFHNLSVNHMELSSSLIQRLQRKEQESAAAENSLERSRQEKEELVWNVRDLNTSLLECQQMAEKSTDEKEAVEGRLKEVMSQRYEMEKGFCPENWKLFGKKCLLFSKNTETWQNSQKICEGKESNMIVVQSGGAGLTSPLHSDDAALQRFLADAQEDFWVGKEFRGNYWQSPRNYEKTLLWRGQDRPQVAQFVIAEGLGPSSGEMETGAGNSSLSPLSMCDRKQSGRVSDENKQIISSGVHPVANRAHCKKWLLMKTLDQGLDCEDKEERREWAALSCVIPNLEGVR
ncbi:uncharacterized protein LOC142710017 [Rhinoderma darwinii]|uniref:uncharacterized protein LOC142710017 n=1 Tax=Rhinoderma darwinii TaxID=43563 RepID=UPI003F66EC4F